MAKLPSFVVLIVLLSACAGSKKIEIQLVDLAVKPCPAGMQSDILISLNNGANRKAKCLLLVGETNYNGDIIAKNVDVFGRVTDSNGTLVLTRRRVGTLAQVQPGKHPFQVQFEAPMDTPAPFTLANFRAKGFSEKVEVDQPTFPKER